MDNVALAFLLTTVAGLSTGIGSLIAFVAKKTNTKFLSFILGLSAGVMIYVSFVELLAKSVFELSHLYGEKEGTIMAVLAFFGGMFLIGLIDRLIPSDKNPHEIHTAEVINSPLLAKRKLLRTGVFTALVIGIHNFPEGIATFISVLQSPMLAMPIVAAIAIHNIPEGIAVSVPVYQATGSKRKAFLLSFASGLSEPVGALIGYLILMPFMNDTVNGILFAAVAGIMVFISVDELLPTAEEYGEHHLAIYGLVTGMAVMAISLILFI
ncbi:MAG: zinc transporter ZupT [Eubacteriales bacterium]